MEDTMATYEVRESRRPGGQLRFDIYRGEELVEGGFWGRKDAEDAASGYELADELEMKRRQKEDKETER
jgi:hypothetical protein